MARTVTDIDSDKDEAVVTKCSFKEKRRVLLPMVGLNDHQRFKLLR